MELYEVEPLKPVPEAPLYDAQRLYVPAGKNRTVRHHHRIPDGTENLPV